MSPLTSKTAALLTFSTLALAGCGYGSLSFSGLTLGQSKKKVGDTLQSISLSTNHFGPAVGESCDAMVQRINALLQQGGLTTATATCAGQDEFGVYGTLSGLPTNPDGSMGGVTYSSANFTSQDQCLAAFPQVEQGITASGEAPIAVYCTPPLQDEPGVYVAQSMSMDLHPLGDVTASAELTCTGQGADKVIYDIDLLPSTQTPTYSGEGGGSREGTVSQGATKVASLTSVGLGTLSTVPATEPLTHIGEDLVIFQAPFKDQAGATNSGMMFVTLNGKAVALQVSCKE